MLNINKKLEDMLKDAVFLRRELHKIPEVAFKENKTSDFIYNYLKELGIENIDRFYKTSIVVKIEGKSSKNTIAFRADMDALPVCEETSADYKSKHDGFMHACGHDGHMTMLLLLIKYINSVKEDLRDDIIFIFQPAEEEISGAKALVKNGIIKKYGIDKIFGIHMFPELQEGVIATKSGSFMAMSAEIDIDISGVSAHGAKPHLGVDTISISASLINDFQKIISRNINPLYPSVITIGRIIGGEARNIISKNTRLEGTIRTFDENVMEFIENRIIEILEGYEKNWGCEFKYDIRKMYPPVINDEVLFLDFSEANKNHFKVIEPQMLAEDFSYYQKEIPGLFVFLGSNNEEKGYTYGLHNSKFDFDEKVLLYGVQGFINILSYYGSLVEI